MKTQYVLHGVLFRGAEFGRVEAALYECAGAHIWRARVAPAEKLRLGDSLRFGEISESMACLLAFLDAEVIALSGEEALLSFDLTGPALDDALLRLGARLDGE